LEVNEEEEEFERLWKGGYFGSAENFSEYGKYKTVKALGFR